MNLENSDLKVELNGAFVAFVVHAKLGDFAKLREDIRKNYPEIKLVFNTVSAEYLFIVKKSKLTSEQVAALETKEK